MVGICRLCATLRKAELLTNITDANHEMCHQLRHCCQVEIRMEDNLPKSICGECIQTLKMAYTFWSKVHESQEALEALFPTSSEAATKSALSETLTAVNVDVQKRKPNASLKATADCCEESEVRRGNGEFECANRSSYDREDDAVGTEYLTGSEPEGKAMPFVEVFELEEHHSHSQQENRSMSEHTKEAAEFELIEEYIKRTATETENVQTGGEANTIEMGAIFQEKQEENDTGEDEMEVMLEFCTDEEDIREEDRLSNENVKDENEQEFGDAISERCVVDWNSYDWRCYLCPYLSSSLNSLQVHALQVHGMKPDDLQYKCSDCQKICPRYHSFLNHVRLRHHSTLALCCDVCNKRFADYTELDAHRRNQCAKANEYPKTVLCTECGKGFLNNNSMQLHARIQHHQTEKYYECSSCSKEFRRLGALRAHQRVHSDVKEYTCELCGRAFRQKANLDVHLYSHISDKPFECNVCKKTFKTSVNLEKHTQVHTDVKQFKCDYCGSLFRTKDAKLSHERTHTGELPFECEYCKKRFRFRSTLLTHLNVHTGRRPYSCEPCNHNFTNWSNYSKHMKRRHPGVTGRAVTGKKSNLTTRAKVRNMSNKKGAHPTDKGYMVSYVYDEQDEFIIQTGAGDSSPSHEYIEILDKSTSSEIVGLGKFLHND